MRTIAIFLILLALHHLANAQKPATPQKKVKATDSLRYERSLHMVGKYYGDSVVLRWAPSDPLLWRAYNDAGYVIERMEITPKMTTRPVREKLNAAPIKPWTLAEWKARARHSDTTAAVAATLLYGKSNIPTLKPHNPANTTDVDLGAAFNQKYAQENRFSMALLIADNNAFVAQGLGLRFVDKTAQKGKTYLYSVHALTNPSVVKSDSAAVLINTNHLQAMVPMPEIRYKEEDRKVTFHWSRTFSNAYFSAYYIERSEDGGKTYKRRNNKPFVQPLSGGSQANDQIVFTDSLQQNYKKYFYRITGITPFGDLGQPSPAMSVMGVDKTAPAPPLQVVAQHLGKRKVKLTWQKSTREPDFTGYMIGRGESMNGPFAPLTMKPLSKESVTYTDTTAVPWGTNYYVVSAIDTARNAGIYIPA